METKHACINCSYNEKGSNYCALVHVAVNEYWNEHEPDAHLKENECEGFRSNDTD